MSIPDIFKNPEYYDILGLFAFIIIISISIYLLKTKKVPKYISLILLTIGILGLLIDGLIIITNFLT